MPLFLCCCSFTFCSWTEVKKKPHQISHLGMNRRICSDHSWTYFGCWFVSVLCVKGFEAGNGSGFFCCDFHSTAANFPFHLAADLKAVTSSCALPQFLCRLWASQLGHALQILLQAEQEIKSEFLLIRLSLCGNVQNDIVTWCKPSFLLPLSSIAGLHCHSEDSVCLCCFSFSLKTCVLRVLFCLLPWW